MDSERLMDLAAAASEGRDLDWDATIAHSNQPAERSVLRELRFLAHIAQAHRTLHEHERQRDAETPPEHWSGLDIRGELGRGAAGVVYRAWDPQLEREVALKLRPRAAVANKESLERALDEGRMLARVRHPHVVTVYGAAVEDRRLGIWMEAIDGVTLAERLQESGRMGAREVVGIGRDLCGALAAVHTVGLVHGDVKAQNVMRASDGRVVLMDFGAGSVEEPDVDAISAPRRGTPLYLAPELLSGEARTPRSDLYALGVLLFELLTGRFPVEGENLVELTDHHHENRRHSLRDLRPELPEELHRAIERALAKSPSDRFATVGEMGSALSTVSTALDSSPIDTSEARPRSRNQRSGPHARSWALGVVAIAAAGVVLWASPWHNQRDRDIPATAGHTSPVSATFEAHLYRAGLTVDQRLEPNDHVAPGDHLYLRVRSLEPVHLYVINLDSQGRAYVLFPLPEAQHANPLPADTEIRLPGDPEWDYDSWQVSSVGEREAFLLVASPRALDRLETTLSSLPFASGNVPVTLESDAAEALRGVGRLARHEGPLAGEAAATVTAALAVLCSDGVNASDLVVREIQLLNP